VLIIKITRWIYSKSPLTIRKANISTQVSEIQKEQDSLQRKPAFDRSRQSALKTCPLLPSSGYFQNRFTNITRLHALLSYHFIPYTLYILFFGEFRYLRRPGKLFLN